MSNKYTWRGIARVTIEAETPLALSSGEADGVLDSLVARDVNGLPYLPGTSIAGVLRHMEGVEQNKEDNLWGFQINQKERDEEGTLKTVKKTHGSELIFSEGRMVGKDGVVIDGLQSIPDNDPFYKQFLSDLPVRQHARIGHQGTVDGSGKYDNQVVFKGTRFVFEVEIVADDETGVNKLKDILNNVGSNVFRIGGGSSRGYGQMKVISAQFKSYDLNNKAQRKAYPGHSAKLSDPFDGDPISLKKDVEGWKTYKLELHPKDFFLFGSGLADNDADMTPVSEKVIVWEKVDAPSKVKEICKRTLIPGASVKGALAHRTAFYYNMKKHNFADQQTDLSKLSGHYNEAVQALFGYQAMDDKKSEDGKTVLIKKGKLFRGNVLISDIFLEEAGTKILNHVKIDRFTGGAVDSALFSEKVSRRKDKDGKEITATIKVSINTAALKDNDVAADAIWAFNAAIKDLLKGRLPLGGGVNRGNGIFTGTMKPEDEIKLD